MNYKSALAHLFSIPKGMKLELETMRQLLSNLGHPEKKFRSIHIAGTNGKGSVSTKIAKALQLAGYRTGLYTSPHISSFRERIQINGELISEDQVVKLLPLDITCTFFEMTTLLAFLHFAHEKVDYAVIETGIGGRKDATNTIIPELSIITSIGMDHMEILGDTIEKIAYEKAGIIKPGIPAIIGPTVPTHIASNQIKGPFSTYDEENSAIAAAALTHLGIDNSFIQAGCKARPPCRIEQVGNVILDVAHNTHGMTALFKSLKSLYPNQTFASVVGLSDSKDIDGCLQILTQNVSHIYLVQAKHRGTPIHKLASKLDTLGYTQYTSSLSLKEILNSHQGPLLICGTFFIMNEARRLLGIEFPQDPVELNER